MQRVTTPFITPLVLSITLFLAGCSAFSTPRASLATLQDAAIAARMTIRPVIDAYCASAREECDARNKLALAVFIADGPSDCPEYDVCNKVRLIIINTLEGIQFAIADANLALSLGQSERYDEAVARTLDLLADVQKQMQVLGIIPGVEDGKA